MSLYHQAFELYGPLCLWSTKVWMSYDAASRLKRKGNMASRRFVERPEVPPFLDDKKP
ncbi:hypothetical protein CN238_04580 [Sinorhizobium meliloti]|nr:hypothetical protein CN238_04580 [Sinorhizobium meliloti]RVH35626.1 hypothetical protein CN214_00045 [Sinorhizobium meliloti]